MMNINDAKAVIKGLQEKPFICSENAIETDNGYVIKRIPKKYSKADKIRSMNDEELADYIFGVSIGSAPCVLCSEECAFCELSDEQCKEKTLKWLQSEAE